MAFFECIQSIFPEFPNSVCEEILDRNQVNNAVPIANEQISRVMPNLHKDIRTLLIKMAL